MWPTLLDLGVIRITGFGLSLVVGFVLGSFILWRRLRDDYDGERLLTLWLWLVVAAWVGSGVWAWWNPGLRQPYLAVVVPTLVLWWWSRRNKWSFWELLDAWAPVSLAVVVLAAVGWGPAGSWVALAAVGGVFLAAIVRRWYRRWRWYRSGKVGVEGMAALAWWGVINLVIAKFSIGAVYSLAWMVTAALVVVYLRSGRSLSDDLNRLWQNLQKLTPKR